MNSINKMIDRVNTNGTGVTSIIFDRGAVGIAVAKNGTHMFADAKVGAEYWGVIIIEWRANEGHDDDGLCCGNFVLPRSTATTKKKIVKIKILENGSPDSDFLFRAGGALDVILAKTRLTSWAMDA